MPRLIYLFTGSLHRHFPKVESHEKLGKHKSHTVCVVHVSQNGIKSEHFKHTGSLIVIGYTYPDRHLHIFYVPVAPTIGLGGFCISLKCTVALHVLQLYMFVPSHDIHV